MLRLATSLSIRPRGGSGVLPLLSRGQSTRPPVPEDNEGTPSPEGQSAAKDRNIALLFAALMGAGALGAGSYWYMKKSGRLARPAPASTEAVVTSSGAALVGGPFSLIDTEGKPITEEWLLGKWTIVYFGFTSCPVICPAELEKLAEVYRILDAGRPTRLRTLFISIDPERDTPVK
jgi:protein SCO1/2